MKFHRLASLVIFLTCTSLYSSQSLEETLDLPIESLKSSAAKAYIIQASKEEVLQRVIPLSADLKALLAAQHSLNNGYEELVSITSSNTLYIKRDFVEQETAFFLQTGSDEIDHYRPTKHKNNPFILPPKEDGTPQFAYTIQEIRTRKSHYYDMTTGTSYKVIFYGPAEKNIPVGPSKNEIIMHIGNWIPKRIKGITIRKTFIHKNDEGNQDYELGPYHTWPHTFKGDKAAGGYSWRDYRDWWSGPEQKTLKDGEEWFDYEYDDITCIAMDPDSNTFYSGTRSGKLFSYYKYYDDVYEGNADGWLWRAESFPINIKQPVDDIELSQDKEFLWILSQECVYKYIFATKLLERCFKFPVTEKATLVAEATDVANKELITTIRTSPYVNMLLLGGSQGTVYLLDIEDKNCYVLDASEKNHAIEDMWWNDKNQVILLNRSGNIRYCTLELVHPLHFFEDSKQNLSPYGIYDLKPNNEE